MSAFGRPYVLDHHAVDEALDRRTSGLRRRCLPRPGEVGGVLSASIDRLASVTRSTLANCAWRFRSSALYRSDSIDRLTETLGLPGVATEPLVGGRRTPMRRSHAGAS